MFTPDFYPTPRPVIDIMLTGENLTGKTVLEPSAGKGNIVDGLKEAGATVIACENHIDLKLIVAAKCPLIAEDFFKLERHQVSHIDFIVMNPPFSNADSHILHAFEVAPPGCRIIALCNTQTLKNGYSANRKRLRQILDENGAQEDLGKCFANAERWTEVEVSLIRLSKPGTSYEQEFDGFLLDEDPEGQANGVISYNVIRDMVNRYIGAVKVFDSQLEAAVNMKQLIGGFFNSSIAMTCTQDGKQVQRNQFKKDLQKSAWLYLFGQLNMEKYATRGLKDDINRFVEKQSHIPFTMANVYKMLEIVIGTTKSRIDRAIIEVFEDITRHHHENRHNIEGWKTNSHYLLTRKFIHPGLIDNLWGKMRIDHRRYELLDDLAKVLCYLTGTPWDDVGSVWKFNQVYDNANFNTWYDYGFFRIKGFKKGTGHIEIKDENVWSVFNQNVARLKGYPLFEGKKEGFRRETERFGKKPAAKPVEKVKPVILATFKI